MNRLHRIRTELPDRQRASRPDGRRASRLGWRHAPRLLAIAVLATGSLVASVAAASAGSAATAGAARPAIAGAYFFTSGTASLKGGGRTWEFTYSETPSIGPRPWDLGLGITTAYRGGEEIHSWATTMPGPDFRVSLATGDATIDSHSSLSPLASLSLSFNATSHKKAACKSGSEEVFSGTLKGAVTIHTGLKGVTVSDAHASFKNASTLTVDAGCVAPLPPCVPLSSWAGPVTSPSAPAAAGMTVGAPGHQLNFTDAGRQVHLKAPTSNTTREDAGYIRAAAPKFSSATKSLSVSSSASGVVTGSAKLAHGTVVVSSTQTCTLLGKTYTEHRTVYLASFSSPGGNKFAAHTILSGTIKVGSSGRGEFSIVTLKRK